MEPVTSRYRGEADRTLAARRGARQGLRLLLNATRSYERAELTPGEEGRLGEAESEELSEVNEVGLLEVNPRKQPGRWNLRVRVVDDIGPRMPDDEPVPSEDEEIDLANSTRSYRGRSGIYRGQRRGSRSRRTRRPHPPRRGDVRDRHKPESFEAVHLEVLERNAELGQPLLEIVAELGACRSGSSGYACRACLPLPCGPRRRTEIAPAEPHQRDQVELLGDIERHERCSETPARRGPRPPPRARRPHGHRAGFEP